MDTRRTGPTRARPVSLVRVVLPWLAMALLSTASHVDAQNAAPGSTPAVAPAPATAAPSAVVIVNQDVRSLGEPLTVSITNGPASASSARIRLSRDGVTYTIAGPVTYSPPGGGNPAGLVAVPKLESDDPAQPLMLGKYLVVVELDGIPFAAPSTRKLEIVPPGNPDLRLDAFDPPSTDRKRKAYFDDSAREKKTPNEPTEYRSTRVVDLVLRGSGFQKTVSDNVIYINQRQAPIVAGKCADAKYGSKTEAVPRVIVAEFVSTDELRLCRVPVPGNGELLVQVRVGDHPSDAQKYLVYSRGRLSVALMSFFIAMLLGLIPLYMLETLKRSHTVVQGKDFKKMLLFMDPETETYSLSKLQFYMWTLAALFGYSYLFIGRVFVQGMDWPDVPGTLPGIIAFSAGTTIGAQVITSTRGSKGAGATEPTLSDFVTSGGVVAPDRVQMLVWTIFGVGAFIVAFLKQAPSAIQTLPAIPEGLLYLMGLSSLGYLGGKLARKPGPVINEVAITPAEPDDAVASAGSPAVAEPPDLRAAISEARLERATLGAPTHSLAQAAVTAVDDAISAASAAQTTTDINNLVDTLIRLRATAEQKAADVADAYAAETDPAKKATAATDASIAQSAAALLQDFSADITQAISVASASPMLAQDEALLIPRTISLRGTNLSAEGIFEIDKIDLPFRMLTNDEGKHLPDVLVREEASPTLARMMKLTIDPSKLGAADLAQFHKWFGTRGEHVFTLINTDGQKAELSFSVPPGAAQK